MIKRDHIWTEARLPCADVRQAAASILKSMAPHSEPAALRAVCSQL